MTAALRRLKLPSNPGPVLDTDAMNFSIMEQELLIALEYIANSRRANDVFRKYCARPNVACAEQTIQERKMGTEQN